MKFNDENQYSKSIMNAIKSGDEKEIEKAFNEFHNSLKDALEKDYKEVLESNDRTILAQRG